MGTKTETAAIERRELIDEINSIYRKLTDVSDDVLAYPEERLLSDRPALLRLLTISVEIIALGPFQELL
jgi:hypothetical protein